MFSCYNKRVIFALCAGMWLASSVAMAAPDGREILRLAMDNEPKARYRGVYVTEVIRPGGTKAARSRVLRNGTQGFRMEFVAPGNAKGGLMVDDGERFLQRLPGDKPHFGPSRARYPLLLLFSARPKPDFPGPGMRGMEVRTLRKERTAGREAWVIEITLPRVGAQRRLWIDTEKWVPLRSEVIKPPNQVIFKSRFESIDFSPDFRDEDFRVPEPPEGGFQPAEALSLNEAQKKAGFSITTPGWVPDGFRREEVALIRWGVQDVVRLRYTNGFGAFTLYESRKARPPKRLPARVQTKNLKGVNITMISNNMNPAHEKRIFDSIQ